MQKLTSTVLVGAMLAGLSIGMAGCSDETGTKEEIKVKTPGGTATETRQIKVEHSGKNPPAAPSETPKP